MKKALTLTLALALSASLVACGGTSSGGSGTSTDSGSDSSSGAEQVTVRLCNTQSETDLQSQSMIAVSERLAEATDGNFVAENYFSSSMGETDDILEQAMQGAAVVSFTDPSRLASFVPDFGILGMPYIMEDYTGLNKIMQTDLYAEWEQEFADQGIWVITSNWYSERPIVAPSATAIGRPIIPVPGMPTPMAFFRILALNRTAIRSGSAPNVSVARATHSATAIGSVHPMAGMTSR